ncbi:hypothetical protein AVEN_201046-1 [Araneus ventricosus]|uniref:Uncharacterized protein n=1 Tax=Araneus ventricosus TaxID=182803 RepID=A0A4Y2V0Z4_ARAVE|nr:hypothetical protein AVEN_201046-1 [Araneus ventricosus]
MRLNASLAGKFFHHEIQNEILLSRESPDGHLPSSFADQLPNQRTTILFLTKTPSAETLKSPVSNVAACEGRDRLIGLNRLVHFTASHFQTSPRVNYSARDGDVT